MRAPVLVSLAAAVACLAPRAQQGGADTVSGRVVDRAGKPVSGAEVAAFWTFAQGVPAAHDAVTTESNGSFSGLAVRRTPQLLFAFAKGGALAGSAVVEDASRARVRIVMQPSVRVHGSFVSEKLGRPIPWTNLYVWSADRKERPVSCSSRDATFDLRLPRGKYLLNGYGTDVTEVWKRLNVTGSRAEIELRDVEIPATFLALTRGKPLPEWHVTAARNAVNDLPQLKDYRGKYLLIEAWGFW